VVAEISSDTGVSTAILPGCKDVIDDRSDIMFCAFKAGAGSDVGRAAGWLGRKGATRGAGG
jgi:hypothetical protein